MELLHYSVDEIARRATPRSDNPGSAAGISVVAAARSDSYDLGSVRTAVRNCLENLERPVSDIVKRGDRVLVKVNMGCSGARDPEYRLTTHPAVVEAIIEALLDCGARVSFGDDVARVGQHCEMLKHATGMASVAARTEAALVDFVAAGAREVPSRFLWPASYLVTNAYFEADVVINAANCRSGPPIVGMSAAIKNMFGCVLGKRKQHIHNLCGSDPQLFGRAIADIHRAIPADLSIVDLTTVLEGFGVSPRIRAVGLLLASTDPVAVDTAAAHAIGYDDLPLWTSFYADRFGVGRSDPACIAVRGLGWDGLPKIRLEHPLSDAWERPRLHERATRVLNNTVLRPRQVIDAARCDGCGDCARRCPMRCISPGPNGAYRIDTGRCADCKCCLKVCESGAAHLEYVGAVRTLRRLLGKDIVAAPELSFRVSSQPHLPVSQ